MSTSATNSRDDILNRIANSKPSAVSLPDVSCFSKSVPDDTGRFIEVLNSIGGKAHYPVHSMDALFSIVTADFPAIKRIYSADAGVRKILKQEQVTPLSGHEFEDVDLAIIKAHFGVSENGAVWITDELMEHRALPFICQHLAVIVQEKDLLPTMHDAYNHISLNEYAYGTFIAGPSKTADIEQSLVLGAHGPKSMTVFIMV